LSLGKAFYSRNAYYCQVFLVKQTKNARVCVALSEETARKIEIIAKLEGRTKTELLQQAISEFVPREIEEKQINKAALYKYLDSRLSYDELAHIIGKDKAKAAKFTRDIRLKGKELVDSLEK